MNDIKKLGRPRKFNEKEALSAAMHLFWKKGYDGTSMKELTQAMNMKGPSIYAAFGDKRALYLRTIEHYADRNACAPVLAFEEEEDIRLAVRKFLEAVIDKSAADATGNGGCFLASCVSTSAGEVGGVSERLEQAIDDTDSRLTARFDREKQKGTLPSNFPSKARAQLMFDLRQGYVFRSRAGWKPEALKHDIDDRVDMIMFDSAKA